MRKNSIITQRGFAAKAISGTRTILIALNCPDAVRKGLKGFAFEREIIGAGNQGTKFLRSQKVFKSIVPDPKNTHDPNDPTKPIFVGRLRSITRHNLWLPHSANVR